MTTTLFIVESPAKAKTISKYLNGIPELTKKYGKFVVVASMGHFRDLSKKDISVDIEGGFKPSYEIIADKKKLVADLGKKIKEADHVLLATDADREGAAISWHIQQHFKLKKYKRVIFNEITPTALKNAVLNPLELDVQLVDAQQARRVLDRIVGYKLCPVLWKTFKTGGTQLSAGRVQSAVLKIIADKEKDIANFTSTAYWTFNGSFNTSKGYKIEEAKLMAQTDTIFKEESLVKTKKRLEALQDKFTIHECKISTRRENPDNPYITSTLQQDAYSKCGFGVKRTMKLAQDLYENGHITYMRTDSYTIAEDAISAIKDVVHEKFGQEYYEPSVSMRKKSAHSQEAHECIRPTHFEQMTLTASKDITTDHLKLYALIWKRTVASRMKAAIVEELAVKVIEPSTWKDKMYFQGKFRKLAFEGWRIVYGEKRDDKDIHKMLADMKEETLKCVQVDAKNTWTSAPERYNESSIIKTLDKEGIGRPSTYATILTKLFEKSFIQKQDVQGDTKEVKNLLWKPGSKSVTEQVSKVVINQGKSKLVPTDIGKSINDFLVAEFEHIVNKEFTAGVEKELDLIAEGDKTYLDVMKDFWKGFHKHLAKFDGLKVKQADKVALNNWSKSLNVKGVEYTLRNTRYGPVAQTAGADGKPVYKDLKNYMKLKGIELKDIKPQDVQLVSQLPFSYGDGYELKSGPYGYYIAYKGKNYKLFDKYIDKSDLSSLFKIDKAVLKQICSYVPKPTTK